MPGCSSPARLVGETAFMGTINMRKQVRCFSCAGPEVELASAVFLANNTAWHTVEFPGSKRLLVMLESCSIGVKSRFLQYPRFCMD